MIRADYNDCCFYNDKQEVLIKLKKLMILFGTVCILNTMAVGGGFATESTVKTEETRSGKILPEEETDTPSKDNDKDMEES